MDYSPSSIFSFHVYSAFDTMDYIGHGPLSVGHSQQLIPWTKFSPWSIFYLPYLVVDTNDYSPWFTFRWPYSVVNTMVYNPWSTFLWPYLAVDTIIVHGTLSIDHS